VALIAAGSAACGTAEATPQGKVQNAFSKLSDDRTLTLGLSFDATADQIYTAMKDNGDFTRDDAKMLAALRAQLSVSTQKEFGLLKTNDKNGSFGFRLSNGDAGGTSLIEIRSVDQKLYLRADVKGLTKLDTSTSSADLAEINGFLDHVDELPSSLAALKAAVKGEWIVIDPKAFTEYAKSMADQFGGGSAGSDSDSGADSALGGLGIPGMPGLPKLDEKTQKQLVEAFRTALSHNATYKDLDKRDGADHVLVSVPAQQFAKELKPSLSSALKDLPGFDVTDLNGLDDVPNRTISVDLGFKGGDLSGITFDLMQLNDKAAGAKLPLLIGVDGGTAKVTAPQGALQLNPQDLISLFMADPSGEKTADL
jgi:hypothetical protein